MTGSDHWQQLRRISEEAAELAGSEREAFLRRACDGSPDLLYEIRSLLEAGENAPEFLDQAAALTFGGPSPESASFEGQEIDGYRIERFVASGGMGSVYEARTQDGSVVAFKVVRPGLWGAGWMERFAREQRSLAQLSHRGIVRWVATGFLPDGRPYLVMEFVAGEPIDEYCRRAGRTGEDKARLLIEICQAVHHAHQNLVLHRDLKPANILVNEQGQPKLLDFGVAKLLDPDEGEDSLTRTEQPLPRTPRYASPELRAGQPVTTATDIYSLGVLVQELLIDDSRRSEYAPVAAMATRDEPDRRYRSADQLAEDLLRASRGDALHARPDPTWYRLRRMFRQHRLASAAIGLAAVSLLIAVSATAWALQQSRRSESQAWRAHAQALEVSRFYRRALAAVEPSHLRDLGGFMQVLAETSTEVGGRLADLPEAEGRVRMELAELLVRMGRTEDAVPHLRRALHLAENFRGFNEGDKERLRLLLETCGVVSDRETSPRGP